MLAGTIETEDDLRKLRYPLIVQPKIDGICCLMSNGIAFSRTLKRIPNLDISRKLAILCDYNIHGELVAGTFNETQSLIMSSDKVGDFKFIAFDLWDRKGTTVERYSALYGIISSPYAPWLKIVGNFICNNVCDVLKAEQEILNNRYEGIIVRSLDSRYKHGRSTFKEQALLKFKRFTDDEAIVVGATYLVTQDGERKNMLGALIVEHPTLGQFEVGTGFTLAQRKAFWNERDNLNGCKIIFKYHKAHMKNRPTSASFKGFYKFPLKGLYDFLIS